MRLPGLVRYLCACVIVSVSVYAHARVCVSVCVCERERESICECVCAGGLWGRASDISSKRLVRPKQYISAFRLRQTFEHYMAFSLLPSLWTISRQNHHIGLWIIRSGGERITSASSRSLWHRTLQKTLRGLRLTIHCRWPVPEPSKQSAARAHAYSCACHFT